jgi:hypothetical protein
VDRGRGLATNLIKKIGRVVRHPMPNEQAEVFTRKAILAVVLLLVPDVVPQVTIIEWSDTEGAISMLP